MGPVQWDVTLEFNFTSCPTLSKICEVNIIILCSQPNKYCMLMLSAIAE